MVVRDWLIRFNARIDSVLAPSLKNRREMYHKWAMDVEFEQGLHLGSGRDRHEFGRRLEQNGEVVALDPDISGLRENVTTTRVVGDGQRLPFADDQFDLVCSEYVFEHLPDPESALAEIDRVLRPGGSFIVLVPNPNHYYARIADLTPFWFHRLWFRLKGIDDHHEERFPTQYEWGTYGDIVDNDRWELEEFTSFPGPTGYTRILPIHVLFTLFDLAMENRPEHHVCYLAHFRVPLEESDDAPPAEG